MKLLRHRFFSTGLRWLIAGIFIYAGAMKMGSPQDLSASIASFAILPNVAVDLVAAVLPPFEIIAGVSVIVGVQSRAAWLALTGLIFIFLVALGSTIARGIIVDCGCFGTGSPSFWKTWAAIGRDILLLSSCGWGYWRDSFEPEVSND